MNGKRFLKEKAAQPRKVLTPQESETWRQTVWRRFRRHRLAMVSCVVLLFLVLAALAAGFALGGLAYHRKEVD